MFSFLKDKLKGALKKFSKKVEEAPEKVEEIEIKEVKSQKKPVKVKESKTEVKKEKARETVSEHAVVEVKPALEVEKKGFFKSLAEKITTKQVTVEMFDEIFWDLEIALLENNVALEVVEKIKLDLKNSLVNKPVPRGQVENVVAKSLHNSIDGLFLPG